jgi:hypothetical protein
MMKAEQERILEEKEKHVLIEPLLHFLSSGNDGKSRKKLSQDSWCLS